MSYIVVHNRVDPIYMEFNYTLATKPSENVLLSQIRANEMHYLHNFVFSVLKRKFTYKMVCIFRQHAGEKQ